MWVMTPGAIDDARCNAAAVPPIPTPEPGPLTLLCTGLAGPGLFWRRRKTL
jgi:hypothetical protein